MFFAVLLSAVGVTWIVQVLGRINFLTTSGQSFFYVLKFRFQPASIRLPACYAICAGDCCYADAFDNEPGFRACRYQCRGRAALGGDPPRSAFAAFVSISSFVIANFIAPYSTLNIRQIIADANADVVNLVVRPGAFQELADNLYIQIEARDSNGSIKGLFVSDSRDPTTDLIYYAKEGLVVETGNQNLLVMKDGEIDRRDVQTGNVSIIKFNTYALDLAAFLAADEKEPTIFAKDRPLDELLNPDPNDKQYKSNPLRYTSELYKQFTEWSYAFVFALIALAAAANSRSHREARISASFTAITLSLIVFWMAYSTGQNTNKNADLLPLLVAIPLFAGLAATYALVTNRQIGLPDSWTKWLKSNLAARQEAFAGVGTKLFSRKRGGNRK